jgi:O-antigen/teichoic acid export membrane protein
MTGLIHKLSKLASDPALFVGAVSALVVKLIGAGGAFLLNIVVARELGAEQAGYFFLAQAVCVFLRIFHVSVSIMP